MPERVLHRVAKREHTQSQYLCLSEDIRAELTALFQNTPSLFIRNVDLHRWWHGRVDKTADDCGDFLLDDGQIAVRMAEVLYPDRNNESNAVGSLSHTLGKNLIFLKV